MRVICSTPPMDGVFGPFVPVGRALADAGHELIVATGLNLQNRIAEAGFATANAGPSAMEGAMAAMADPAVQLAGPDERWRFPATMFGGVIAPRKLSALRELADRFEPDLVLHPPVDLAGPLLAAERNLPSVSTDSCIRSSRRSCAEWRTASSRYGRRRDSKPIPTAASTAGVTLTRAPPSLRLHREAAETVAHPIRNEIPGDPEASLPGWAQRLGDRPTLYVSLGTVPFFNQPGRFQELLQEVVNDDVELIVTVSELHEPEALGEVPPNVHVEQRLPLAPLLQRCDAVLCHAGSGTTLAALTAGLPLVLVPDGADQFINANACQAAGVARTLAPDHVTPTAVRDAVRAVLAHDSAERFTAKRIATEIAAMPAASDIVHQCQDLVLQRCS